MYEYVLICVRGVQDVFLAAWPAVRGVSASLRAKAATAENEGVMLHVVRFLEAATVAHLLCDVSR